MTMSLFGVVFLSALVLGLAARLWLARRHAAHVAAHRDRVPPAFAAEITLEAHQRAADYTCAKTRFSIGATLLDALLVLLLTFGGGLNLLHGLAASAFDGEMSRGLALIALFVAVTTLAELPFSWYRVFRIEERFGFNKMTAALFWADFAKGLALAAVLGLPLAAAVLWFMQSAGAWWWVYAWMTWAAFNLAMLAAYPTWIAPLFNKFSPMQDAALRERVERLLERCGFKVQGLMVMDGSRRSSHGNAYFSGFGNAKRIVFFDTLLTRLDPPEVEAVLAHELGHFRLRHVAKRLALMFAASLALLWLLSLAMQQPWFYSGLGVHHPSTAMALILLFIVVPCFTFPLQPLASMMSRQHEFEADEYAARHASAADLVTALVKLYKDNASTLTPDPLHSAVFDSHPPALVRIGRLQRQAG